MSKPLAIFVNRFGWFGFVRVLFYPLTTILTTPIRLVQTLWNCRILLHEKWCNYSHFNICAGLNSLFYWNQALNMQRFGRSGFSPYIGLGKYPLSCLFYNSFISLYLFWKAGAAVLLLGMLSWLFAHLIWLQQANIYWVIIVMFLTVISTTFYANLFSLQNYNVLGWLFFPLGLYGIITKSWIIAAIAWFFASFGSFTVVFLASIISFVSAVSFMSFAPVFTLIPAGLKLATHFYHFLIQGKVKVSLLNIMKLLGITSRGVKYKRVFSLATRISLTYLYFLIIYGQFFVVAYLISGKFSILFLTGVIIFVINSSVMRFADMQSMQMLVVSLAIVEMFQNPDPRLLLSYWILVSPLPLLASFPFMRGVLDTVPKLAPFSAEELRKGMQEFLAPVKSGERVLMAFDDPKDLYENLFDGYRFLLELPLYVAAEKEAHFMPDWFGVRELNYKGAPDIWGRDINSVLKNVEFWKANYTVVYQDRGTALKSDWELAGFKVLSKFSWESYEKELRGVKPYSGKAPDWWLLKIPSRKH